MSNKKVKNDLQFFQRLYLHILVLDIPFPDVKQRRCYDDKDGIKYAIKQLSLAVVLLFSEYQYFVLVEKSFYRVARNCRKKL